MSQPRDPFAPPVRPAWSAAGRLAAMALIGAGTSALVLSTARPWLVRVGQPPVAAAFAPFGPHVGAPAWPPPGAGPAPLVVRHADFGDWTPTPQVRQMTDWVLTHQDNRGRQFMVLDKADARVYLFTPEGRMLGNSPVLLGKARGDDSVPGIGTRPMDQIRDDEKTTPAGRFETSPGRNLNGESVVWVDYEDAISMHRARKVAESEHRFERLATPTPDDNRISYGCINVPWKFFDAQVAPTLGKHPAVAYIIPEVKTIAQVFDQHQQRMVATAAPATGGKVTTDR